MKLLYVFLAGIIISFIGSLPLGTINVAAFQISLGAGIACAAWFALGSIVAELIYVRISFVFLHKALQNATLFRNLRWVTFFSLAGLALAIFLSGGQLHEQANIMELSDPVKALLLGFGMMVLNPVQIPFWMGWGAILFEKNIMQRKRDHYNLFTAGAALGSVGGSFLFILAGNVLTESTSVIKYIQLAVGGILMLTALLQLIKILSRK